MMDFKSYVKTLLEASKEDEDEEKVKDEDSEEDLENDEENEEEGDSEEKEASVKTKKKDADNGCEPSVKTKNKEPETGCEPSVECPKCGKKPCCCKKNSLKEEIMFTSRYSNNSFNKNVISEETRILVEGINNNRVSKYLAKLAKKAEKEAAKYANKGMKEEASVSKKAASNLKEASNKIFKCETRYQNGDPSAKQEYKQLCKQYSKELKIASKGARGVGLVFAILAGIVLLGAVGTTVANDDIIEKLNYGFQNKEKMPEVLKGLAKNDKKFIEDAISKTTEKAGELLNKAKDAAKPYADKVADSFGKAKDKTGETLSGMKKSIRLNLAGWE